MNNSNTKLIWAVAVIVLLLAVGGVFALFDKSSTTVVENGGPSPTLAAEVAGTENWAVYQGEGYSFKHPADFTFDQSADNPRLVAPVKTYFRTILADEAYLIMYPARESCPESQGENFFATTSLSSVDRTVFSRHEWSGVGAGQLYRGVDYSTIHNGLCYQITLYTHSANGAGFYFNNPTQIERTDAQHKEDMEAFLALIDKAVSTFQFTPRQ